MNRRFWGFSRQESCSEVCYSCPLPTHLEKDLYQQAVVLLDSHIAFGMAAEAKREQNTA